MFNSLRNFYSDLSPGTKWAVAGTALVVGGLATAYFVKLKQQNENENIDDLAISESEIAKDATEGVTGEWHKQVREIEDKNENYCGNHEKDQKCSTEQESNDRRQQEKEDEERKRMEEQRLRLEKEQEQKKKEREELKQEQEETRKTRVEEQRRHQQEKEDEERKRMEEQRLRLEKEQKQKKKEQEELRKQEQVETRKKNVEGQRRQEKRVEDQQRLKHKVQQLDKNEEKILKTERNMEGVAEEWDKQDTDIEDKNDNCCGNHEEDQKCSAEQEPNDRKKPKSRQSRRKRNEKQKNKREAKKGKRKEEEQEEHRRKERDERMRQEDENRRKGIEEQRRLRKEQEDEEQRRREDEMLRKKEGEQKRKEKLRKQELEENRRRNNEEQRRRRKEQEDEERRRKEYERLREKEEDHKKKEKQRIIKEEQLEQLQKKKRLEAQQGLKHKEEELKNNKEKRSKTERRTELCEESRLNYAGACSPILREVERSLHLLPLALHQNTLGVKINEQVALAHQQHGSVLPPLVKAHLEKQRMGNDAVNACAFLTTAIIAKLLERNQIMMCDVQRIAETTIRKLPSVINNHRDMGSFYDVYLALDVLQKLHQIPPSGTLQELLIRNPFWYDLAEDLRQVLFNIFQSSKTVGCAFICEPLVFSVFCCTSQGERKIGVIDTHEVPSALGGTGNGLLLWSSNSTGAPQQSATNWIMKRLHYYGVAMDARTSLLSLTFA